MDPDGNKSVFGEATREIDEFKDYLADQNRRGDSQLAAAAIGTAQFVATLGQAITAPLDVAANVVQEAVGVDDQQVRDELAATRGMISDGIDFLANGDYAQAAKNVHQAAVNETVKALEGDVTATANVTQVVVAAATLRSATKGKPKITEESPSGPSALVRAETGAPTTSRYGLLQQLGRNNAAKSIKEFRKDMRSLDTLSTKQINSFVRSFELPTFRYGRNVNPFKKFYRHFNDGGNPGGPWIHDTKSLLKASPETRKQILALPAESSATATAETHIPFLRKAASGTVAPQPTTFTGLPENVTTGGVKQWYVPSAPDKGVPYLDFEVIP